MEQGLNGSYLQWGVQLQLRAVVLLESSYVLSFAPRL